MITFFATVSLLLLSLFMIVAWFILVLDAYVILCMVLIFGLFSFALSTFILDTYQIFCFLLGLYGVWYVFLYQLVKQQLISGFIGVAWTKWRIRVLFWMPKFLIKWGANLLYALVQPKLMKPLRSQIVQQLLSASEGLSLLINTETFYCNIYYQNRRNK